MSNCSFIRVYCKRRRGVSVIEYGILAALIGVFSIASVTLLGGNLHWQYCSISDSLSGGYACGKAKYDSNGVELGVNYEFVDTGKNGEDDWTQAILAGSAGVSKNGPVADELAALNTKDPITHIYGLYNTSGTTIGSYAGFTNFDTSKYANAGNGSGASMWTTGGWAYTDSGNKPMFQVVGASGTVYNVNVANLTGDRDQSNNYAISISNASNNDSVISAQPDLSDYYCCNGNVSN